jgi:HAE1 family hydrophobic/amphiphilic exporter-1
VIGRALRRARIWILMASGALIFGLLPMALSRGTGSEFHAPMAIITIGGLTTSTLLTLVVVPVAYDLIEGATERLGHGFRRLRSLRPRPAHRPD